MCSQKYEWTRATHPALQVGGDLDQFVEFLRNWAPALAVPATYPHHATVEDFHRRQEGGAYATYHTDHQVSTHEASDFERVPF